MNTLSPPARGGIYLVQPRFPVSYWGLEHLLRLTPFNAIFPPLGLLTLGALTPPEFPVTLCDENAGEAIDYDTDAEIVCITGYIIQMAHVFEIADAFRARGKKVVLGGPLANLLPHRCREHCDVLFEGEAEYTWPRFLREYAAGNSTDHYVEPEKIHLPDSPPPRLNLLRRRYAHGIVQCTRGCPFTCEFCDIIVMYGRKMRFKPIERVIEEIEAWARAGQQQIFFADDNFIGHRAYAKDLLRALGAWNGKRKNAISFYTQASVDMVRDVELMELLRDANFASVFVGVESPRKASLAETQKTQNERIDLVGAIHKIQSYNLLVSAGMIVGFDADDADIFEEQYQFLQEAGIPMAMLSVLLAIPKTPLYERLKAEGRLLIQETSEATNLVGTAGGTNFHPLRMTREELTRGQGELYRRLYTPAAFRQRVLANLSRFENVTFRPKPISIRDLLILARLALRYASQGWEATKFFWGIIAAAAVRSPRSIEQVVVLLGMYQHFCRVHAAVADWNPWSGSGSEEPKPRTTRRPPVRPTAHKSRPRRAAAKRAEV